MLIDLHVSSATPPPLDQLVARVAELGLDGVVVSAANDLPRFRRPGSDSQVAVFAAAEVETDRGRYLVIFPEPENIPALEQVFGTRESQPWPVRDVLARTQALQGAVVALAPYDASIPHPGGDILYTLPNLAAVQTVSPAHPAGIAHPAIEAAEVMGLPCVGGSDAKAIDEVGRAATLFSHPVRTEAELVAALRAGACWPVEFGAPSPELLVRGRSSAPREPAPSVQHPAPAEGGERRRRRRRR